MGKSGELKYKKIAAELCERIRSGVYKAEEILPGQKALAEEFQVNHATIRKAQNILQQEGFIYCIPSVGVYARPVPDPVRFVGYVIKSLRDPFHLEMIRELDNLLATYHAALLVSESNNAQRVLNMNASYIIKAGQLWNTTSEDVVKTVYIGSFDTSRYSVTIDNNLAMNMIYQHLNQLGHQRIVYISAGLEYTDSTDMRLHALVEAASPAAASYIRKNTQNIEQYEEEGFSRLTDTILNLPERPTALVCGSDWIAVEVLQQLLKRNIRVPEEISITGFDDIFFSKVMQVPLTTIRFPIRQTAEEVIKMLFKSKTFSPYQVILKPDLIIRNSTAKALAL